MTAIELVLVLSSSGVLAGGLGVLKYGLSMERRVMRIEVKLGLSGG